MNETKTIFKSISGASQKQNIIQKGIGYLLKGTPQEGLFALLDQGVVSATNFLTGVIVGRVCAKEEFGLYLLGFSIVLFFLQLQGSLILSPYIVFSPKFNGKAHAEYTGSSLIYQLALSVLTVFVLIAVGALLSFGIGPHDLAATVWTLVIVITLIMFKDYARRVCFAGMRMKTAFVLDSCVAFVQICGLVILAQLNFLSASRAYVTIGFACGITSLVWLISSRKSFSLEIRRAISHLGHNWSFGKWVFASDIVLLISMQLYPWFLLYFYGAAATGVYAACIGLVALFNPLVLGLGNFFGPKAVRSYRQSAKKLYKLVLMGAKIYTAVAGALCLLIIIFGGRFLVIIYGSKYVGNSVVVSILALGSATSIVGEPASYGIWAMERPDVNFKINLIALIMTITLGIWLVSTFGTLGVACGLLASNIVVSLARYTAFSRLAPSFLR